MLYIRPVAMDDLDQLLELASLTGYGLTTLPRDPDLLRQRIDDSLRAFAARPSRPAGESYLFVMEHWNAARIVGTCGIWSKVGGFEPSYMFRIQTHVHESEMLKVRNEIPALHLVAEHNGPTEIGSLFLDSNYRRDGNGRLLSLARFLFMAEYPQAFEQTVIAEMRGVIDERGHSPFWDALGRHFFNIEFLTADYLCMVNKRFIADLMPRYPLYIPLLAREAQGVIGRVHEQTRPALRLLEREGFVFDNLVDIFEAGPVVSCPLNQIRTIRQSTRALVLEVVHREITGEPMLVASMAPEFRVCRAPVETVGSGTIRIGAEPARILNLMPGSRVRMVPLHDPAPVREEPT